MALESLVKEITAVIGALCGQLHDQPPSNLTAAGKRALCNPFIEFVTTVAFI
jgi:hypothetical protein